MAHKAFVTGGTGSIGKSIVETLSSAGIEVRFQFKDNRTIADELASKTGATAVQLDLQGRIDLDLSDVDILVNSAGIILAKTSIEEVDDEEMYETFEVNVMAPFRLVRAVVPGMIDRKWGRIISIGSIYAHRGTSRNASYNISKHALLGLTRSAAKDLAKYSITANQIDPSAVDSAIIDAIAERLSATGDFTAEKYKNDIAESIPVGRLADPKDIASAVAFLASPAAGFITGEALVVDGGYIA